METFAKLQTVAGLDPIQIGFNEAAVLQVEGGEWTSYLIAAGCTTGREVLHLHEVWFCGVSAEIVELGHAAEVMISCRHDWWSAVNPASIDLLPCPSRQAYPLRFISRHGFRWMADMIRHQEFEPLLEHLHGRFQAAGLVTDRRQLRELPFSRARTAPVRVHPLDRLPTG
ncbi:hypothetical protein [Haloferula sargassicola]|uniref:Uncharacterized protein n=1 Tax=Haloferula sargassicola TaxID=490096 RepID=A0ABP9UPP5_9BACT